MESRILGNRLSLNLCFTDFMLRIVNFV